MPEFWTMMDYIENCNTILSTCWPLPLWPSSCPSCSPCPPPCCSPSDPMPPRPTWPSDPTWGPTFNFDKYLFLHLQNTCNYFYKIYVTPLTNTCDYFDNLPEWSEDPATSRITALLLYVSSIIVSEWLRHFKMSNQPYHITKVDIWRSQVEVVFVLGPFQGHLECKYLVGYLRLFTFAWKTAQSHWADGSQCCLRPTAARAGRRFWRDCC